MEPIDYDAKLQGWRDTGIIQEITEARQDMIMERADADYVYHIKSETHYWVVFVQHKAVDSLLDSIDGTSDERRVLDFDTITGPPAVLCYICETSYEPQLRKRKCPGEPNG